MLEEILKLIAGMAGLGAFTSMLINLLKVAGLVKDGQADKAFKIADLIVFVIVTIIYLTKTPVDWAQVDEWLVLLTALLGYVVSVFSGEFTHDTIKGTPLIRPPVMASLLERRAIIWIMIAGTGLKLMCADTLDWMSASQSPA